ncbi:hypothetical protein [Sphingomonas bacterium]
MIRFTNAEVMGNPEGVPITIGGALSDRTPPLPGPLPIREREL